MKEEKPKHIAIFGGSFNPIHKGHINSMTQVMAKFPFLDSLVILPNSKNPLRAPVAGPEDEARVQMIKLAGQELGTIPWLLDSRELERGGVTYTVDTANEYLRESPENKFYFVIGLDNFLIFDQWKDWSKILGAFNFIVTSRPGYEFDFKPETFPSWLEPNIKDYDPKEKSLLLQTGRRICFFNLLDKDIFCKRNQKKVIPRRECERPTSRKSCRFCP